MHRKKTVDYVKGISFVLHDAEPFRSAIATLDLCSIIDFHFRFTPDGFSIQEKCNNTQTLFIWEYPKSEMVYYYYNVTNPDGEEEEEYNYKVSTKDLVLKMKMGGKNISFKFTIHLCLEDMSNDGIIFSKIESAEDIDELSTAAVKIDEKKSKKKKSPVYYTNPIDDIYPDHEPCAIFTPSTFAKYIKECQNSGTNNITFVNELGVKKKMYISSKKEKKKDGIYRLYEDKDCEDEDEEDSEENDNITKISTQCEIKKVKWMLKLPSIVNKSLLKVFIEDGNDLVILTRNGTYGRFIILIPSVKEEQ